MENEIRNEIYTAMEKLGAKSDLLGVIGSWGEKPDEDTLADLKVFNSDPKEKSGIGIYNEEALASFGKYLLSEERASRIASDYSYNGPVSLSERLAEVYDADIRNWEETMIGSTANSNS